MSQIKLFFDPLSQPARAVWIFLKANKLPMKEVRLNILGGDLNKPEFQKINPLKKVPAIEHDGFKLTESVAIMKYLCSNYKIQDPWFPSNSRQMAKMDEYMSWHHMNLRAPMSLYFLLKVSASGLLGPNHSLSKALGDANADRVSKANDKMDDALESFQTFFLNQKPFITGDQITIADILAATELEQPKMVGHDMKEKFPQIVAYLDRMNSTLNPLYAEGHKEIWSHGEDFKKRFGNK